jgi:Vitamin K-dependent gamma-carboxylase
MTSPLDHASAWTRFWHAPVRAERLALTRILVGVALLTDQLFQYLQHFADFFGPEGVAPAGFQDAEQLRTWHWTILIFGTDNLTIVYAIFGLWMAFTLAFTLGWHTRVMGVLVWFLTICFLNRNPLLRNDGDNVLAAGLFLLMLSPCGRALSLDWLRERRRPGGPDPPLTPAWPVRLLQIQLCVIYCTTGLAKLRAIPPFNDGEWGTWYQGTSIYYVLHDCTMARRAYAEFPIPFWVTQLATWISVGWETLFPVLVLCRWTRKWALWFGVLFHLGIYLTIEVGWFSFYTVALYGVWVPGEFWDRFYRRKEVGVTAG